MRAECGSDEQGVKCGQDMKRTLGQMLSPYGTGQLARRMCVLLVLWFTAAASYYGLALNATNIR